MSCGARETLNAVQGGQLDFMSSRSGVTEWVAQTNSIRVKVVLLGAGYRAIALEQLADEFYVPCVDRLFTSSRCPAGLTPEAMRCDEFIACKAKCRWKERGIESLREVSGFRALGQLRKELAAKSAEVEGSDVLLTMTWVIDGKAYRAVGQGVVGNALSVIKQLKTKTACFLRGQKQF